MERVAQLSQEVPGGLCRAKIIDASGLPFYRDLERSVMTAITVDSLADFRTGYNVRRNLVPLLRKSVYGCTGLLGRQRCRLTSSRSNHAGD